MSHTIGIDWGNEEHAVCVVDESGAVASSFTVAHDRKGLRRLLDRLGRVGRTEELRVAVERPSGLLVDTLVDVGYRVVPIHPNAVKASRPRYSAAGGKSDPGDAYILADMLRTDGHRFRELQRNSDELLALRALVRSRDDLVAERVAMANQLRANLEAFWPGAARIFADIDSPIALAFLQRYPTPAHARRLGPKRMAAFLAQHRYSGRRSPEELLERLRDAPDGKAGPAEMDARGEVVRVYVSVLVPLVDRIRELSSRIAGAVDSHPDGAVIRSFPRTGKVNAGQILAELGDCKARFASGDHLAAEAGVCPVTFASGKRRGVAFRWACNRRLRSALTTWAGNSRHKSTWARRIYDKARARGADHPHAVRILARAWCRVLWRAWQDGAAYDPSAHGAAARLAAA